MKRLPATVRDHQPDACCACDHGTALSPERRSRENNQSITTPVQRTLLTPELMPPLPKFPSVPPYDNTDAQASQMNSLPPRHVYLHSTLPSLDWLYHNASPKDGKRIHDCIADWPNSVGISSG
jgi:hypothetical protein